MSVALLLGGALWGLALPVVHAETRFLSTIQDLPLAPGLEERAEDSYVFPAPEGRITQVEAEGPADEAAVRAYYRLALPPLGWAIERDDSILTFVRGRERLDLRLDRTDRGLARLRFRLVARPASLALD